MDLREKKSKNILPTRNALALRHTYWEWRDGKRFQEMGKKKKEKKPTEVIILIPDEIGFKLKMIKRQRMSFL